VDNVVSKETGASSSGIGGKALLNFSDFGCHSKLKPEWHATYRVVHRRSPCERVAQSPVRRHGVDDAAWYRSWRPAAENRAGTFRCYVPNVRPKFARLRSIS